MDSESKIFGIGSARTGTTSLGLALKKLGFNHKPYGFVLSNRVYTAGDYDTFKRVLKKLM